MKLTYVSLFAGIEAFSVAASRIRDVEWNPLFFSEIDPFCCQVLAHHFPNVPNLGDVTKIQVKEGIITNGSTSIPVPDGGIDILAGGSPCQGFSVAGKRLGLADPRSGLAMHYARLVDELRPRVLFYENVPGMLSSAGGLDFYAFVRTLAELGYADLSYRTLDCQYVTVDGFPNGIPQRRRRVFLVGVRSVGHSRTDVPASAQILFEPARMLGIDPPRREKGKGFACPAGYRIGGHDRVVEDARSVGNGQLNQTAPEPISKTLDTMHDAPIVCVGKEGYNIGAAGQGSLNICDDGTAQTVRADTHPSAVAVATFENHAQDSRVVPTSCAPTMGSSNANSAGVSGNNPIVVFGKTTHAKDSTGANEKIERVEVASTRNTFDNGETRSQEFVVATGFSHANSDTSIGSKPLPECGMTLRSHPTGENAVVIGVDVQPTFGAAAGNSGNNRPTIAYDAWNQAAHDEVVQTLRTSAGTEGDDRMPKVAVGVDTYNGAVTGNVARTLNSAATDSDHLPCVLHYVVRRLTVVECSRLQGFPDLWLRFPTGKMRKIDKPEYDYLAGLGPEVRAHLRTPADSLRGCYETDASPDSACYRALGNSWATNCAEWILRRVVAAFRLDMIPF